MRKQTLAFILAGTRLGGVLGWAAATAPAKTK